MAQNLQKQLSLAAEGVCESLSSFCLPKDELFSSIVAWSAAEHTGVYVDAGVGVGLRAHPCGEYSGNSKSRRSGWYSWHRGVSGWKLSKISPVLQEAIKDL